MVSTVRFVEELVAEVVVTARLDASGNFTAHLAGSCEYAPKDRPGATVSADLELDTEAKQAILAAMTAGRARLEERLGRRLALAKALAYQKSAALGEL